MIYTQEFLYNLSGRAFEEIEFLLDLLKVDYKKFRDRITGACPVHQGDNQGALSIKHGVWTCYTQGCQKEFSKSMIGLVRGILSAKENWSKGKDKHPFYSTVNWMIEALKVDKTTIPAYNENRKFNTQTKTLYRNLPINPNKISRSVVRSRLKIPPEYLLERGFTRQLLDSYDIGLCEDKNKDMWNRVVIPLYQNGFLLGCLGRTINKKCEKCKLFHWGECPTYYCVKFEKWLNSEGLKADSYLFNLGNAKKAVKESGKLIIVEGPLDCLRLEQNGIKNAVALLGSGISEEQTILLERLPLQKIYTMLDTDEAGIAGTEQIKQECRHLCPIQEIKYDGHDPESLDASQLLKIKESI